MILKLCKYLGIPIILVSMIFCGSRQERVDDERPNIVVIIADDMGYSDLGCFGSEISTPNLDELARHGTIFSQFYTAATCSPTRAMFYTGTDHHIAGLGDMAERLPGSPHLVGKPGYEGYLNNRVLSVSQSIKDAGYHTYLAGKWHLGLERNQSPKSHGFDRSFSLLSAYANHYYPNPQYEIFWEDDDYVSYPNGEYSTDIYTDKLIDFVGDNKDDGRPFFMVAAYTSPHWPLQVPQEYADKYKGVYDEGFDVLRRKRFEGLKEKDILNSETSYPELPERKGTLYYVREDKLQSWDELSEEQKRLESRAMEVYAGMVDNMDVNVGRLVDYLKSIGEYDNTMFVFFSDNGAAAQEANLVPEGADTYTYMGTANSFLAYGPQWAHASSGGYAYYKGYSSEGGLRTPMIIKMPNQQNVSAINGSFCSVKDLAPSFLDIVGADHPSSYQGRKIEPMQGQSIIPALTENNPSIHDEDFVMGWELFGRKALRMGKWKLRGIEAPFGKTDFELFDIEKDPTESQDLSDQFPDKRAQLIEAWAQYIRDNGVILTDQ